MRKAMAIAVLIIAVQAPLGARVARADEDSKVDLASEEVVYIVSTAHLDTQWRWTIQDTIRRFIPNTLRGNFGHFDRYPGYRFSFEGAFRYMLAKEYYPEEYEELKRRVAAGHWRLAGSWVDAVDTNVPSPEALIRHALYGNGFFRREFGKTSRDVFLPDCFGFGYALPSIARHCGILGFSTQKLTWGSSVGIPYDLCRWRGPDGSAIVAALNPGSYVRGLEGDVSVSEPWAEKLDRIREKCGIAVDYHYIGVGDQGGAVHPDTVDWVRKSVDGTGPTKVISTGSDQLYRDLEAQPDALEKLPIYEGEFLMTAHGAGCYTSQAAMKRWNRKNELLADAAERASVVADWVGGATYPREKLTDAWVRFLWHGFHDDLTGTSIPQAYVFSWNDEILSLNQFSEVLTDAVGAVARGMDTRVEGVPVVVYNPLSIDRQDIVEARIDFPGGAPDAVRCLSPSGEEVPVQIGETTPQGTEVLFLADLPSVGFAVFDLRPAEAPGDHATDLEVAEGTLENDRYAVRVDENGDVTGIRDKRTGEDLLRGPIRIELHDNRSPRWPAWEILHGDVSSPPRRFVGGPAEVRIVERGPVRVALEVIRQAEGSVFLQTIRLGAGEAGDRIEFDTEVIWQSTGTLAKVAFPWSFGSPKATYDLGLGTIERGNNTEKLYEVPAQQWAAMDAPDGKRGAAVLNDCKYGWDKPDDGTLRLTLIHTPEPRGYRDQATQDIGRHRLLYAVSGYEGDWRAGEVPWKAARLNQPLLAFRTVSHEGTIGRSFSFLRTNTRQVSVKAIKQAEASGDVVVRLQEMHGEPARGVIAELAAPIEMANETNGAEEGQTHVRPFKGTLACDLGPYQPRTYALRLAGARVRLEPPASRPVSLPFDVDVVSLRGEGEGGEMDGEGHAYPGDLFPDSIRCEGIAFDLGPVGEGERNAVACASQSIPLPAGEWTRLYLLAAAAGGDAAGTFTVGDREVPLVIQDFTELVGQWDSRIVDGAYIGNHRISGLAPGHIKRDPVAWVGTHRHARDGEDEPYVFCYLFRYAIDLPEGAATLTLPKEERIRLFAVSVAAGTNDDTAPARPLHDTMDSDLLPAPSIVPAGGEHTNALKVAIEPFLRASGVEIRYTTDGSDPTRESPLYEPPLVIGRSGVLRARLFRAGADPGLVGAAEFVVEDSTAPEVGWVVSGDPYKVRVTFSEPVERESAETVKNYIINPYTKVDSAILLPDLGTVELTTWKLDEGVPYTLKVRGVRDRSAAANPVDEEARHPFEHVVVEEEAPVLHLRFDRRDTIRIVDASGKGPPGEGIGGPSKTPGKVGAALRFDGVDDCVVIRDRPDLNPTGAITISAWIHAEDWKGNRRILQKGVDDSQYRLLHEGGWFRFHLSGVGIVDTSPPSTGEWHHVAGTYDGKAMRIYVDGEVAAEREAKGPIAVTSDPVYVGTKTLGVPAGDFFKGLLDEVIVYDHALGEEAIAALAGDGGR